MRVAHLTDFHLRRAIPGDPAESHPDRHGRRMPDLLPEALARVKASGADLLAVTGDLVDAPLAWIDPGVAEKGEAPVPADAFDLALADYRLARDLLDAVGLPWFAVPGNHDWERAFFQVFDRTPADSVVDELRVVRFFDREGEGHVPHRLGEDRDRFARCLADADATPQLHLQHYVVTPALNEGYPHTYADGEQLADQASRSGRVRLSLNGHYHKGTDLIRRGPSAFATTPAFCVPPYRWRLFDIDGETVTMSEQALVAS